MKRFNVVMSRDDGGVEIYPMKEWLRQHPEHLPSGVDATFSTSHQLRNALKKAGWSVGETPTEVRLLMPGTGGTETLVKEVLGGEPEDEYDETAAPTFELEYQLRDFIAQNLNVIQVKGKRLRLYVDPTGRDGIEFPSSVGPIDLLAIDDSGAFFVFELKRKRSPDHAVGQLARYMGWVRQTIGKGREVHGIIVAKEIGDNLRYAASVVPKVSLFEYKVEFHLKPADQLPGINSTML